MNTLDNSFCAFSHTLKCLNIPFPPSSAESDCVPEFLGTETYVRFLRMRNYQGFNKKIFVSLWSTFYAFLIQSSHEGTFSTAKWLLSSDSVRKKIDSSEL